MVGFGVRDADTARAVAAVSDGAVVGSAIVSQMAEGGGDPEAMLDGIGRFVAELRSGLD